MAGIDILKDLSGLKVESRVIDIPFLIKAQERGIAKDSDIRPAIVLIAEELARSWTPDTVREFFNEIDIRRNPFSLGVYTPYSFYPTNIEASKEAADRVIRILARRFPGSADGYRPWMQRIENSMADAKGDLKKSKIKEQFEFLQKSVEREIGRQEIYEKQFWNGINAAILAKLDPAGSRWLIGAQHFLGGIGAENDLGHPAGSIELEALSVQIPILSAAIFAELKKKNVEFNIIRIGEKTVVRIDGEENPVEIDTPQFAMLDVSMGARELRAAGDRLVALPVGQELIGRIRWRELWESPLFLGHQAKLIPSTAAFRVEFPKANPGPDAIEKNFSRIFPKTSKEHRIGVIVEGKVGDPSYRVKISDKITKGNRRVEIATLSISIEGGSIIKAEYIFPSLQSGYPLSVAVDDKRLLDLIGKNDDGRNPRSNKGAGGHGGASGRSFAEVVEEGQCDPKDSRKDTEGEEPGAIFRKTRGNPRAKKLMQKTPANGGTQSPLPIPHIPK